MGEFELIDVIKKLFSGVGSPHLEGIGDDCAVIPAGGEHSLVITTDMLLEGRHFLRAAAPPFEIGRKSLAVNLSDVAAMGARPVATLLSIGLPRECTGEWAEEFMRGYRSLSGQYDVALIGGDTTLSETGIAINVVAIGEAAQGKIKRRSGARAGDLICLTGRVGASAAGLRDVLEGNYTSPLARIHHNPSPHVEQGLWLGLQPGVHSMIDLSDGLASDLRHILKASGVGARVDLSAIPTDHSLEDALQGGEDYVLLFTALPEVVADYRREVGELYVVGEIEAGHAEIKWMRGAEQIEGDWRGFTHF